MFSDAPDSLAFAYWKIIKALEILVLKKKKKKNSESFLCEETTACEGLHNPTIPKPQRFYHHKVAGP